MVSVACPVAKLPIGRQIGRRDLPLADTFQRTFGATVNAMATAYRLTQSDGSVAERDQLTGLASGNTFALGLKTRF